MCGFVAWVGRSGAADRQAVARMLGVIHHRGPDDEGTFFSGPVGFGFRRLSILDLSPAGHQPMQTPDGRHTIVFNGEIYNFVELRAELSALGHRFISGSDTEVLLHAYTAWGGDCVHRFNGMWSFLIHDKETGTVFGARDRFGMKPLYWHATPEAFLFASEIKSIRASGHYRGDLNWATCARFFHEQRLDDTTDTFFAGIQSIPAGHRFSLDARGNLSIAPFWAQPDQAVAPADPPKEFAERFEKAVAIHMRSDVPVGVNLSGGLDSTSIICAIAREHQRLGANQALQAFCFTSREYDESTYLAATLGQTGATQRTLSLKPLDIWSSLPRALWFQDEPVHSITAVVGFHLSDLAAKNGVKVILNGQGADETLGGYPSYFRDYWYSTLVNDGFAALKREIEAFSAIHGGSPLVSTLETVKHVAKTGMRRFHTYRRLARRRQLDAYSRNDWFDASLCDHLSTEVPYCAGDLQSTLRRAVTQDPLPLYLRVEDRNAMAHSVEARLPFLDPNVVEFAGALPPAWKLRGPWNKYILREAMRDRIPENVRVRPDKMGFPTPFSRWLREELYESAAAIIHDPDFATSGPWNTAAIRRDLERHRRGEADLAGRLFDVIQFHLWRKLDCLTPPSPV